MKAYPNTSKALAFLFYLFYLLFFISLAFSFRAFSSISIGLIFIVVIIKSITERQKLFPDKIILFLVLGCALFYAVQFLKCINTLDDPVALKHLRIKSGLLFIPVAVGGSWFINEKIRDRLLSFFSILVLAGCLYCVVAAFINFYQTKDLLSFFYYELIKPFDHHAIYFSIIVFFILIFLIEKIKPGYFLIHKWFHYSAIIFLSFFLILLSSRLVISFYIFYLLFYFISSVKKAAIKISIITAITALGFLVLFSNNPVGNRFKDIIHGDLSLVQKERFDPGDYFGGLQFRLFYWRLVPEILTENKSWLTGVGPANSQSLLDKKYREMNLYIGEPSRGDTGFLGYNTHSQFLESLLQTGLIGLLIFIFICLLLIKMMLLSKNRVMIFVTLLLLIYSLIESVFETQYGLLLFLFFPLFLSTAKKRESG